MPKVKTIIARKKINFLLANQQYLKLGLLIKTERENDLSSKSTEKFWAPGQNRTHYPPSSRLYNHFWVIPLKKFVPKNSEIENFKAKNVLRSSLFPVTWHPEYPPPPALLGGGVFYNESKSLLALHNTVIYYQILTPFDMVSCRSGHSQPPPAGWVVLGVSWIIELTYPFDHQL